jgi:hypothetical protein
MEDGPEDEDPDDGEPEEDECADCARSFGPGARCRCNDAHQAAGGAS